MFNVFILPAIAIAFAAHLPAQAAEQVGVREIKVPSAARGESLDVTVWYPVSAGGTGTLVGDNRLFVGAPALEGAPPAKGQYPLVLFSHGSGGSARAASWLANRLVEAGFVVAAPNHPGTTSGDSLPVETPLVWKRTRDLSDTIDFLAADPIWRASIDESHIGVVGFSLGGATALEISGARADLDAYARYCDSYKLWDCGFYAGRRGYKGDQIVAVEPVDLRKVDKAKFEQSNLDPRVRSAVMVDPGLAHVVTDQSIKDIGIPMTFINLGDHKTIPMAVDSKHVAALARRGAHFLVAGANHFSFLPVCKSGTEQLLKQVEELDPICTDVSERSRKDIHNEIANLTVDALVRTLKPTN